MSDPTRFTHDDLRTILLPMPAAIRDVASVSTAPDEADGLEKQAHALEQILAEHRVLYDRLIGRPDWYCVKCGGYSDGSGQSACPHCGTWHYLTSANEMWKPETPQAQAWLAKATGRAENYLAKQVAASSTPSSDQKGGRRP